MARNDGGDRSVSKVLGWGGVAVVFVFGAWLASWALLGSVDDRGTWGDMFGGVNALFSGLAFAGVVIAILLQREELSLQRQELAETRAEIAGQREEMELQNATLRAQLFESSFIQLLAQLRAVARTVLWVHHVSRPPSEGATALVAVAGVLERTVGSAEDQGTSDAAASALAALESQGGYGLNVGGYLTFAREMLVTVEQAPCESRERYRNLLRAQMSSAELSILAVKGMSGSDPELSRALAALGFFSGVVLTTPHIAQRARAHLPGAFMESELGEGYSPGRARRS